MSGERPVTDGSGEDEPARSARPDQADAPGGEAGTEAGAGHTGQGTAEGAGHERPQVIRKRGRRVSTEPAPGYTGEPPRERTQSSENDARLWEDLPPHWGKR